MMKKSTYLAALAALALASCSDNGNEIFDQSAADRLEQYKKDYTEVLTADGGLWSMEYFCNPEEPGYVFVMKFDKDGSVQVSANHIWIGGEFKQETSIWKMIADNGPVLTFNSYNNLFHIFSDPGDITGPNAPQGESGEINETGYGHEGDYEFQVMEVFDEGRSVRLLGKKRMIDIFLHRLDSSTDVASYLAEVKDVRNRFSAKFNNLVMTDDEGNRFNVSDLSSGIPSFFPLDGDAVTQTVSANGIFTLSGFRFMNPLEVKKADGSTFEISELMFREDGTMGGVNVADLRAPSSLENLVRADLTWTLDAESMTGKVKELYDAANAAVIAALSPKDKLGVIEFTYGSVGGKIIPQLVTRLGTRVCRDYIEYDCDNDEFGNLIPSDVLKLSVTGGNNTSLKYEEQIPEYKAFKDYFKNEFIMMVRNPLSPEVMDVSDRNNASSSFSLSVK